MKITFEMIKPGWKSTFSCQGVGIHESGILKQINKRDAQRRQEKVPHSRKTSGAFGWYDLEQDRTAGAHGAASCQPNATPETEHIFVEKCAKLGAFFKMCMDHHGHFVRYDESNHY